MTEQSKSPGDVVWIDLTVPDAERLRDFYQKVMGWKPTEVVMGGYADYIMTHPASGAAVVGICHATGINADLPPQWLVYIRVADLEAGMAACEANGGTVIVKPKPLGSGRYCVLRDPAGAVLALIQD
jgi:hypothetical protein